MNDAVSPPAVAAVVALRIRDFLRAPVAKQVRLKDSIVAIVNRAAAPFALDSRIVLDAADGLVVVVLAGPADALALAQRAQAGAGELALRIGLDYGPVKALDHERRGSGLVGEGIVSGLALAAAATPGRIAASRSFREVLDWAAPGRAAELVAAGSFTDASSSAQEMYTWDPAASDGRRRRIIAAGALGVAAILGLGVAARVLLKKKPVRPAILEFHIAPRGEVVIDGIIKGEAPPLKRLEVDPGARVVEIRATGYAPLKLDVNLAPQQTMIIQHTFAKPAPKPRKERRAIDKKSGKPGS